MKEIPIIDAHQHFWDLSMEKHPWLCRENPIPFRYGDYSSIKHSYLPVNYQTDSAKFNVVKTVHMEAEWDPHDPLGETEWLMQLHEDTGFPNAIVGQAWFTKTNIEKILEKQASCPLMRSIRHKPSSSETPEAFVPSLPGSMADPAFRQGYASLNKYNLHFDLQTPWWHLKEAAELAYDFPETTVILNHTGLPSDRTEKGIAGWKSGMKALAAQSNSAVKISGICVPDTKWTADLNYQIVRETIRIFGIERCMFASNFPVDGVVSTFSDIYTGFAQIVSDLSDIDQRKLFHDNAVKFYRPS